MSELARASKFRENRVQYNKLLSNRMNKQRKYSYKT